MSSSHLCPCPACNRHVMTDAGVCPFCQVALPAAFCAAAPPPAARGRMSRAARLLAGATLVGVSACSSQNNVVAIYGAPIPVDAGVDQQGDTGAGGTTGSGGATGTGGTTGTGGASSNDAAEDRSAVALYGGPFPTDGSASG